jgi:hypothetical protein
MSVVPAAYQFTDVGTGANAGKIAWWIGNVLGDVITTIDGGTHTISNADIPPAFIVDGVPKQVGFVGSFEGSVSGGKLQSIAGVSPVDTVTKATYRGYAQARGSGWQLETIQMHGWLGMLIILETASLNSQGTIGNGVSYASTINTGYTATAGTAPSGNVTYGNTTPATANAVSYRGVENLWGNVSKFIEGIRTDTSNGLWIAPQTNAIPYSDASTLTGTQVGAYINTGSTAPTISSASYITSIFTTSALSGLFFPSAASGGSSTTYFCDIGVVAAPANSLVFYFGGNNGTTAGNPGIFMFSSNTSAISSPSISSRLQYFPQ